MSDDETTQVNSRTLFNEYFRVNVAVDVCLGSVPVHVRDRPVVFNDNLRRPIFNALRAVVSTAFRRSEPHFRIYPDAAFRTMSVTSLHRAETFGAH